MPDSETSVHQVKDPLVQAAAWRVATQLVRNYEGTTIEEAADGSALGVQASGLRIAEFDLTEHGELRPTSLPPLPSDGWAWPMPDRELRRLVHMLGSSAGATREKSPDHKVPWLVAMVITRVLSRHALSGIGIDVSRPRTPVPSWLTPGDVEKQAGAHRSPSVWVVGAGARTVGALVDEWLLTPRGERINLFARYLDGASVEELSFLVLRPRTT